MSNIDLAIFLLTNILSFLIGGFFYFREGSRVGYKTGVKDEQMMIGIAISRAFADDKEEALKKVATEYRRFEVEIEQKMQEIKNAG